MFVFFRVAFLLSLRETGKVGATVTQTELQARLFHQQNRLSDGLTRHPPARSLGSSSRAPVSPLLHILRRPHHFLVAAVRSGKNKTIAGAKGAPQRFDCETVNKKNRNTKVDFWGPAKALQVLSRCE